MRHTGSISYFKMIMSSEEFASHLGKILLLPVLLDGMLYELDMEDPQKND